MTELEQKTIKKNSKNKLLRVLLWGLGPFVVSVLLFTQGDPLVLKPAALSAEDAKQAKTLVKGIMKKLGAEQSLVEVTLKQTDLDAMAAVAAHTIPNSAFDVRLSQFGMLVLASIQLDLLPLSPYLNIKCLAAPGLDRFEIDNCQIGHVPVPGSLITWSGKTLASMLFGKDVERTLLAFLEDARVSDDRIQFTALKSDNFSDDIKSSISEVVRVASAFNSVDLVETQRVEQSLAFLNSTPQDSLSLAVYMSRLFEFRASDSQDPDAIKDNAAAMWALIIHYGNPVFARALGMEPQYGRENVAKVTLRGRHDLALHFLYSIALEQISESDIGLNVGELKEILDSSRGGSGFSFADLAADKAGLYFSDFAVRNRETAQTVQWMLAGNQSETLFFPRVEDLPEGLSEREFSLRFGTVDSERYKKQEAVIDGRIENLPLYQLSR